MAELQLGIKISADGKSATAEIQNVDKSLKQVESSAKSAATGLYGAESAARLLGGAMAGISAVAVAKDLFEVARQADRVQKMMEAASGGAALSAVNMDFASKTAKDLGLDLNSTSEAFAKLTAAAKGTSLQGEQTRTIFTALSRASAALGMSSEESSGALLAISQMMSKGKVSAEELRGQLGERLPGAFNLAAQAMGVTTDQLDEMLSKGEVVATEFLPKFAKVLDETYSTARFDGINNKINRLSTTWTEFKQNFIDTAFIKTSLDTLTQSLDGWNKVMAAPTLEQQINSEIKAITELEGSVKRYQYLYRDETEKQITAHKKILDLLIAQQKIKNEQLKTEEKKTAVIPATPDSTDIQRMVAEAAKKYSVNQAFALAIAEQESRFKPGAVSNKGATGVMQLMPATAQRFGVDPQNLEQNIDGGMRYLKLILDKFHGDMRLAAAGYNAGENSKSLARGVVPNIPETLAYVDQVQARYEKFQAKYPGGMPFADAASAKKEADAAYDVFKANIDRQVSDAENAANLAKARGTTAIAQIELERKAVEQATKAKIDAAPQYDDKLKLAAEGQQAQIGYIEREAEAQRRLIDQEQTLLQARLDAINQQIAGQEKYNQSISVTAKLKQDASGLENGLRLLAEDRARVEIDRQQKINETANTGLSLKEKQAEDERKVRESQLRMNAVWDQTIERQKQYAETWTRLSGQSSNPFAEISVALVSFSKQLDQIPQKYEELNKLKPGNEDANALSQNLEVASSTFNVLTETSLQMRAMFKEGTAGYEAMTTAAGVFSGVAQVLNVVEGVGAVIHQLRGGDVWTAIPRAMGVAAMIASMGVSTGATGDTGVGASNAGNSYDNRNQTGTVFGDATAKSDSIASSLQLLQDNSSIDLNYSAGMLAALNSIDAAMGGVTNSIITGVSPQTYGARLGKIGGEMDPLLGAIGFMTRTRKVTDYGLSLEPQALSAILKKGFIGQVYTDITTETKSLGMTLSKSTRTVFSELDSGVSSNFTKTIRAMRTGLIEAGAAFGLSATDFDVRMKRFVVDFGKVSLQGLKGEELQKQIGAMFSAMSDEMARKFMPGLGAFRKAGEGYFQTLVRTSEGVNRAGGELDRLGVSAINYKQIINKQGDIAAEIVRQSLTDQAQLSGGIRRYITELTGTAEDITGAYKKLVAASNLIKTAGMSDQNLSRAMTNAAGGLDAFLASMQGFTEHFLSQDQRTLGDWTTMAEEFSRLGLQMPTTKQGFKDLVLGIDQTTVAGQKLFGKVISLESGFNDLGAAMDEAMASVQEAYDRQKESAKGLRDYVLSLSISDPSLSPQAKYSATKTAFESTLAAAKTGDEAAQQRLQTVSQAFLDASREFNASSAAYGTDLQAVTEGVTGVATSIDGQLAAAEQQIAALSNNTSAVTSLADALNAYRSTQNAVTAITTAQQSGTQTVADINAQNTAYAASDAYLKIRKEKAFTLEEELNKMFRSLAGDLTDKKRADIRRNITAKIDEINASEYKLGADLIRGGKTAIWSDDRYKVNLRARGGWTEGPTIVGEKGPELIDFKSPVNVQSAGQTTSTLAGLAAAIQSASSDQQGAIKAGVKVDQAGYQAMIVLLTAIDEKMAAVDAGNKLARAV